MIVCLCECLAYVCVRMCACKHYSASMEVRGQPGELVVSSYLHVHFGDGTRVTRLAEQASAGRIVSQDSCLSCILVVVCVFSECLVAFFNLSINE